MERLGSIDGVVVTQQKEWGEIFTGFETKNRYIISDAAGTHLYGAAEEPGSVIFRMLLKALRPFTIVVLSEAGETLLRVNRPFRFYFHEAEVCDAAGERLGSIKRQFSFLRRIYSVYDKSGAQVFQLNGPLLHPWTFHIEQNGASRGKITKKWSGLLKEGFTDADNFNIDFPADADSNKKALLLGIIFLIDFVHFENKGK